MASVDVEIRKLDFQSISDLSDILDYNEDWKRLMAIIPADLGVENCKQPKYTGEHFGLLEYARKEQNRSCTAILIEEWGTSGRIRPRLSTLRDLLVKAELFRAADYVSKLLNEPSPERPENGPAAPVSIPDVDQLPIVPAVPVPSGGTCLASNVLFPTVGTTNELTSFENRTTQLCLNPTPIDASNDKVTLPFKVLCDATDNFNENLHLGSGSCGAVYLGTLQPGDRKIAVKRLHREGVPGEASEQFKNEIKTLSQLSHPNLLTLLGFSSDGEYLCLVYPFMGNGSLSDILENQEKKGILNWKLRLDIALGLANGIAYLHKKSIIHRDIKTANVLLDDSLEPKLGDFGLVRPRKPASGSLSATIFTQTVVGTSPYMSLEAFNGVVTDKMDVFSFGVVLLELMTGLPAFIEDTGPLVDYIFEKKSDSDSSSECFMQELIDRTAGNWSSNVVNMFSKLALECLASEKSNRPNMVTIIEKLQNIIRTK